MPWWEPRLLLPPAALRLSSLIPPWHRYGKAGCLIACLFSVSPTRTEVPECSDCSQGLAHPGSQYPLKE